MATELQDSLAKKFADAGIELPNSDAPPPGPVSPNASPPVSFALPSDVAARVAQQNAVADTGPVTVTPPAAAPIAPFRPPAAAPAAAPDPLAAQLARAGGGGGKPAPFVNPYANQMAAAAEGGAQPFLNAQLGIQNAAAERGAATQGAADEATRYANAEDTARAANAAEGASIEARHDALVKSEAARDYTKEYWGEKSTGQKVAGGLSAILGGFLQGWNHLSSNPAIDQQNKDIERYIDEKKAKSALRIGESRDAYSHFLSQTKDDAAARALTHAALLGGYREKLEEAGAQSKDQQEMLNAAQGARQIDMQVAAWKDAAAIAQSKRNAPMTLQQLVELQSKLADMRLKQSEVGLKEAQAALASSKAAGVSAPNETAANAGRDLQRLTAGNGGEVPGSGFVGRSLAGAANGEGFGASLARAVRGEDAQKADAAKYELATQAMQMQNPKARFSPAQIADYMKREGFNGPPEVQREAIARAQKATRRAGPGAALQEETANGGAPAGFEEP